MPQGKSYCQTANTTKRKASSNFCVAFRIHSLFAEVFKLTKPITAHNSKSSQTNKLTNQVNKQQKRNKKMATINLSKLLFIILVAKSLLFADALKCYQCGMYNEGVGSITPCLNYTETTAQYYLKDCPRSSDNYCIVS